MNHSIILQDAKPGLKKQIQKDISSLMGQHLFYRQHYIDLFINTVAIETPACLYDHTEFVKDIKKVELIPLLCKTKNKTISSNLRNKLQSEIFDKDDSSFYDSSLQEFFEVDSNRVFNCSNSKDKNNFFNECIHYFSKPAYMNLIPNVVGKLIRIQELALKEVQAQNLNGKIEFYLTKDAKSVSVELGYLSYLLSSVKKGSIIVDAKNTANKILETLENQDAIKYYGPPAILANVPFFLNNPDYDLKKLDMALEKIIN